MYKCECGTAHGNVETPWQENMCPNCNKFPTFAIEEYKVCLIKINGWYCGHYKNNETNFWYRFFWSETIPSYNEIYSYIKNHSSNDHNDIEHTKVDYRNDIFISPEAAKMIKEWDLGPTQEEADDIINEFCSPEIADLLKKEADKSMTEFSKNNGWGNDGNVRIEPTGLYPDRRSLLLKAAAKLATSVGGFIPGKLPETGDVKIVEMDFLYDISRVKDEGSWVKFEDAMMEICKLAVVDSPFISMTGGCGPIFPYGDMPQITESEPESKTQCSCDIFLLMQSGCKCGFIEKERQNAKVQ